MFVRCSKVRFNRSQSESREIGRFFVNIETRQLLLSIWVRLSIYGTIERCGSKFSTYQASRGPLTMHRDRKTMQAQTTMQKLKQTL